MARIQKLRKAIVAVAAIGLAVSLVSCSSGSSSPGTSGNSEDQAPIKVTLGLPVQATTLAPVYLATQEKIWQKYGLDVKVITFSGDAPLVKALASGDLDIVVSSLTGAMNLEQAGQDVQVVFGGFNQTAFAWYAPESIKNIKDGKDKKWGITSFGSSTDLLTRYAVARSGLDPDKDIKYIKGGASAARLAAMKAGQIDVNIFTPPYYTRAEAQGYHKILDLGDLVDQYPMHLVYGMADHLNKNPEMVQRVVDAISDACQQTKDDPDTAAKALAADNKISVTEAKASIESWIDQLYPDGRLVDDSSLEAFWKMGMDGKLFKSEIPKSKWFTTKYIDNISIKK